jgi:hypothetical protein
MESPINNFSVPADRRAAPSFLAVSSGFQPGFAVHLNLYLPKIGLFPVSPLTIGIRATGLNLGFEAILIHSLGGGPIKVGKNHGVLSGEEEHLLPCCNLSRVKGEGNPTRFGVECLADLEEEARREGTSRHYQGVARLMAARLNTGMPRMGKVHHGRPHQVTPHLI